MHVLPKATQNAQIYQTTVQNTARKMPHIDFDVWPDFVAVKHVP